VATGGLDIVVVVVACACAARAASVPRQPSQRVGSTFMGKITMSKPK
jgi:hypothetical protein